MPDTDFLAANSIYIENLFRHAFLFDLSQHLLLQNPPRKLTILNSEVDDSGVDLVLTLGSVTRQIQMKTLNKPSAPNPYNIADSVFLIPGGCVVWLIYDHLKMQPMRYHFFGKPGNGVIGNPEVFPIGYKRRKGIKMEREGYRLVKTSHATHKDLLIGDLCAILFGEEE